MDIKIENQAPRKLRDGKAFVDDDCKDTFAFVVKFENPINAREEFHNDGGMDPPNSPQGRYTEY